MQHRNVARALQLAGLAALAAGLILTVSGAATAGLVLLGAAFLVFAAGVFLPLTARRTGPSPAGPALKAPAGKASAVPAVGRAAAAGDGTEDPRHYLGELILPREETAADPRPAILAVCGPDLAQRLEAFGPVVQLLPGTAAAQIRRGAPRLLVIDRRSLDTGLWAHTETGAGSVLLRELAELVRQCQARHVGTVFLDSKEPDGFYTSTLRKLCRTVMPLSEEDLNPEGTPGSGLMVELQNRALAVTADAR